MAGAAQTIGWILTIDSGDVESKLGAIRDNVGAVRSALGDSIRDALQPAVAVVEDLRDTVDEIRLDVSNFMDTDNWSKIVDAVKTINTQTMQTTEAVKTTSQEITKEGGFWNWLKYHLTTIDVGNVIKGVLFTVSTLLKGIKGTIEFILNAAFSISGIVYFVTGLVSSIVRPIFGAVRWLDKTLSAIVFGTLKVAVKSVFFLGKTVTKVLASATGTALRLIVGLVKLSGKAIGEVLDAALGPVYWLARFLGQGLKRALGPVYAIFSELLEVFHFALKPIMMLFRITIVPFAYLLFPLLVKLFIWAIEKAMDTWEYIWKDLGLKDFWAFISSGDGINGWWKNFQDGWNIVWEKLGLKSFWEFISSGDGIKGWWRNFRNGWKLVWEKSGMKAVWEFISGGDGIKGWWKHTREGWDILYKSIQGAWRWLTTGWGKWWDGIKESVSGAWDTLKETAASWLETLGGWFVKPLRMVQRLMADILIEAGHFITQIGYDLPSKLGGKAITRSGASIAALGASLLPKEELAEGGLVEKPTVALVGEAGPELVIPLGGPHAVVEGSGQTVTPLSQVGTAASGTDLPSKVLRLMSEIRDYLADIADNTEDSSWVNDGDFNGQQMRGEWEQ